MSAPTRRAALRNSPFGLAGLLATQIPDVVAAPSSGDAALIAGCQRVLDINVELSRVLATRLTVEDDERTEPEVIRLEHALWSAQQAVESFLPPTTQAGLVAVARAASSSWLKVDGKPDTPGFEHVAAVAVLQTIVQTVEDEACAEPDLNRLSDERDVIMSRLKALNLPCTTRGVRALASAALTALAPGEDDTLAVYDYVDWLAASLILSIADRGALA